MNTPIVLDVANLSFVAGVVTELVIALIISVVLLRKRL